MKKIEEVKIDKNMFDKYLLNSIIYWGGGRIIIKCDLKCISVKMIFYICKLFY